MLKKNQETYIQISKPSSISHFSDLQIGVTEDHVGVTVMTKVVGDNTAVLTHSSKHFTVVIISFNPTAILRGMYYLPSHFRNGKN